MLIINRLFYGLFKPKPFIVNKGGIVFGLKIVKNKDGRRFLVWPKPIKGFLSKKWYCQVVLKERFWAWNFHGKMDFILDGMAHQCNTAGSRKTDRRCASFFDSPDPTKEWGWRSVSKHFRLCIPLQK
jgi:hypothetical protein